MTKHALALAALFVLPLLAANRASAQVEPGDTFSFDFGGYSSSGTQGFLTPEETVAFGTTEVFFGLGPNGQNLTISSSESIASGTTTDTFSLSTPSNFVTTNTVNGITISQLGFHLGDSISGSNTVDLTGPATGTTGTITVDLEAESPQSGALTGLSFYNGDASYSVYDIVNTGSTAPIDAFQVNAITYSVSYNTITSLATAPEPGSCALALVSLLPLGVKVARRRQLSAA